MGNDDIYLMFLLSYLLHGSGQVSLTRMFLWRKLDRKRNDLFTWTGSVYTIEEGRAASKSPHQKFVYCLSISQQGVSADIIQNFRGCVFGPHSKKACVQLKPYIHSTADHILYCPCGCENMYIVQSIHIRIGESTG